jgi:DNA polymerase
VSALVRTGVLATETDLDGFRAAARAFLQAEIEPAAVSWVVAERASAELAFEGEPLAADVDDGARPSAAFAPRAARVGHDDERNAAHDDERNAAHDAAGASAIHACARVPADFVALCRDLVLHRDPQRFALMYRLLWRLQHEPGLRRDALDAQMAQAQRMAQAVRRDVHKMRAFVRFRPVAEPGHAAPLHGAWFEPDHHIVDANAGFFERRFVGMRWAILTPERCLLWDGERLRRGPGAARADAPAADDGEAMWLTYYRSIFNPARLKLRMMEREMPRRYWRNLPEAVLIAPLAAQADERRARMIEEPGTVPRRRIVPLRAIDDAGVTGGGDPSPPSGGDPLASTPAQGPTAWQAARSQASHCLECPIGAAATQTVWGEGPLGAPLMLVGEQPGDREDLEGRPFVGPAGQLLARALERLGWTRDALYLTNAVKHFKYEPRGKRRMHKTAAQREADACQHWLEREIELVRPQAIVALGETAARQLLGRPVPVLRARGQWFERADGHRVLVTLHPAALLRGDPDPLEATFETWVEDLRLAGDVIGAAGARPADPALPA